MGITITKPKFMSTGIFPNRNAWSAAQPPKSYVHTGQHFSIDKWQGDKNSLTGGYEKTTTFKLIWMTRGQGSCTINFTRYELNSSVICFIPPDSTYRVEHGVESSGYIISFRHDFILLPSDQIEQEFYRDWITTIKHIAIIEEKGALAEMEEIAGCMQREYSQYSMLRPDILCGWLKIFLVYVRRVSTQKGMDTELSRPRQLVNKFYALLDKNSGKHTMVSEYAAQLAVAPQYLNETVKKISGYPASHHIQQRTILEAKTLAIHSTYSHKEIAYRLGFIDPGHFSKFFKNYTGQTFKEFRNQNMFIAKYK